MRNVAALWALRGATLTLTLTALVAGAGCSKDPQGGGAKEAIPVTVGAAARQDIPLDVQAIGHVEPYSTVSVKARVGGEVVKVGFREGQDVRQGSLLFQIDPRPYEAALGEKQAQLERDHALAENAGQEAKRYADLVQKDYVTKEQYDATRSNAAAALSTVKADEAAVENARLQLLYCTVTAPISGRTGAVLVYPGNQVKGNDDKPLVVLNQIQPVYVSFSVPESSLAEIRRHVRPGQKLKVTASPSGSPASGQTGDLTFLDNTVDPATGTILLKATFGNSSETLWPGEYMDVLLTLATEPNAIVVPSQAIQTGQSGQYVYVVKDDLTVESRPITVGRIHGALALVSKGLEAGERVVTDGQLRLSPGARVEIKSSQGQAS
ncbi:MAG TPA: efflux RND transporter periplasmic adaptor subunit [Thermoanaerobaculia bacterium]|nr:efflux RND transporter periplasmic adaptor subunit [Thermoanaerobaculia bacterium]